MTPPAENAAPRLQLQNKGIAPGNGGELVGMEALKPGDILLTSASSIMSVGIQVLTLAPVSHAAVYLGEGQVAEAVGGGVQSRSLEKVLADESIVVAFRHPKADAATTEKVREFAVQKIGTKYNQLGVVLHAPFAIERRLCELPLIPGPIREFCTRGVAAVQLGASSNDRFFCSQFVLEAYRQAGLPITSADPRWVSPADILHMREGDVPSIAAHQPLQYVGHLKYAVVKPAVPAAGAE
ncbi:MAG: YaeF family permuted papain-like enzyme [Burkholderiaceae bacterium]